ncbi:MAG: hypothetical protein HOQ03_13390 [Thermoleophilia bacterium]|nr:hypothetical protein [Thermoleophilia bacterium]
MSQHKDDIRRWYKARHQELRELVWEWDPLALTGGPDDEYDSVVDGVLSALVNGGDARSVSRALREGLDFMAGEEQPSSSAEYSGLDPVVRRVCDWWGTSPSLSLPPPQA